MNGYDSDMNFLLALRQQSPMAFDQLYAGYYRPLCYFAEELTGDPAAAQDLVTESFIKLLQRVADFDSTKSLKSFLYTVTRNACYDHLRAQGRHAHAHAEIRYLQGEQSGDADRLLIKAEVLQAIDTAIEKLPEKYKGVIRLALFEDKNNERIAEDLQLALQTVRNRKSEGFRLLRMALNRHQRLFPVVFVYYFPQLL